jgi:hypothetical protein
MRRFVILALAALALGGCANKNIFDRDGVSVLKGGVSITAPIANPATPVTIYQVKSIYATALDVANGYRDYCYSRPYAALMQDGIAGPVCKNRRSIVTKLQAADDRAAAAIDRADAFIRNNPTISAVSVVREAWSAVTSFQSVIQSSAASVAAVK